MSTIAAIATPDAPGGISVIRISGKNAMITADKIFKSSGKKPSEMDGYTCEYGYIYDDMGVKADDVILTVFKAPKSYTGENVVEISCHGGRYISKKILRLILKNGAVPAKAGEFTKRAFMNGKMSLTQAEAVMDVIASGSENELRYANALKDGAVYRRITALRQRLIGILGDLAAWADFPEEDIPEVEPEELEIKLFNLLKECSYILNTYDYGKIIREGIDTVIVGKPNVGKSTLMNYLTGCQRSIVTEIAGTTRDVIEESVKIGELTLKLSDTAGIRETDDVIEGIGVEIAYKRIKNADLILAVFDSTNVLDEEDKKLIDEIKEKNCIALINKTDKENILDKKYIYDKFKNIVEISAKNEIGIDKIEHIIQEMFNEGSEEIDRGIIANERQRDCLIKASENIKEALDAVKNGIMLDAITVLLDSAADYLLELTGDKVSEKVVDEVFSRFCVGK